MSPFLPEVIAAWLRELRDEGPARVAAGVAVGLVAYALLRGGRAIGPRARSALVAAAAAVAVGMSARRASVVDDAFIAFRYARNLLDGHGLVFNVGERVEGFTDLSWVLLVAAGSGLTGVELPLVALVLNLAAVAGLVLATDLAARRLGGGGFPLAAAILAGHGVVWAHGTTGLETAPLALLTALAFAAVGGPPGATSAGLAGLAGALAVTTRPDAGLVWLASGLGVWVRGDRGRALGAWAASTLLLAAVEAWRIAYYGDWLPNTAYAKSATGAYWSQGLVYTLDFWLGSASWLLLGPFAAWLARGTEARGPRAMALALVAAQLVYVGKIGGDFMSGRFYVLLLPLLAVAAERAGAGWRPAAQAALAGALAAGAGSVFLGTPRAITWYIADEGSVYPVRSWRPVAVDHRSYAHGTMLRRTVTDRGLTPVVASGTIGMLGYYGGTELVDVHGLTDRTVARTPVATRGHIGHEKTAPLAYLRERHVTMFQGGSRCHGSWEALRALVPPTGPDAKKPWCLLAWDPALAAGLAAAGWRVPDPEAALGEALRAPIPADPAEELAQLDAWFGDAPRPEVYDALAARWRADR